VILRRGLKAKPGRFERMVAAWCKEMGHPEVYWALPDPSLGSAQVFTRDRDMVSGADIVLAFFSEGHVMEGGTGHVVEAAIDHNVPTYSFTLGESIQRVGEHDPTDEWGDVMDAWFTSGMLAE
jgi:hypothetical protein